MSTTSKWANQTLQTTPLTRRVGAETIGKKMDASELAQRYRTRLQQLEDEGAKRGFEKSSSGVIEHSDIFEVVGYTARQREPRGHYDGLALRIMFQSFPQPVVDFRLQWTSWMADPALTVRADYPPVVLKKKSLGCERDTDILKQAERFVALLSREINRGQPG
jgi:hypothetical protein